MLDFPLTRAPEKKKLVLLTFKSRIVHFINYFVLITIFRMSLCLFFKDRDFNNTSTKELIVRILCNEWPLSVRQIHERMKRTYGISCSYQAVFKQVKALLDEGILSSNERYYKINEEWLARVNIFLENLLEYYEKNPDGVIGASNKFNEYFSKKSKKFAEINSYF